MVFTLQPRRVVFVPDRRAPAARAARPVADAAQPLAAETVGTIPQPNRPDDDVMRHPEQSADRQHSLTFDRVGERIQAGCECGWQALGTDRLMLGATQAWTAHMYAAGHRTLDAIREATEPATRPQPHRRPD